MADLSKQLAERANTVRLFLIDRALSLVNLSLLSLL
jgi:Trm5-related predicted tRNA methylase